MSIEEIKEIIEEVNLLNLEIDACIKAYNKEQREIAHAALKTSCNQATRTETRLLIYTDSWKNPPANLTTNIP